MKILLILVMLFLSGCGATKQTIDCINVSNDENISQIEGIQMANIDYNKPYSIIIGDSIANYLGSVVVSNNRYIETVFNMQVINFGHNGEQSWQIKERWNNEVLIYKPEFVILHIGINDIRSNLTQQQFESLKDNYIYFAETCKQKNIKLYVMTIDPVNYGVIKWNQEIKIINSWLKVNGFNVIDTYNFVVDNNECPNIDWYDDGLHPNDIGCVKIIDFIKNKVL